MITKLGYNVTERRKSFVPTNSFFETFSRNSRSFDGLNKFARKTRTAYSGHEKQKRVVRRGISDDTPRRL